MHVRPAIMVVIVQHILLKICALLDYRRSSKPWLKRSSWLSCDYCRDADKETVTDVRGWVTVIGGSKVVCEVHAHDTCKGLSLTTVS
jgi:hypothetical protein